MATARADEGDRQLRLLVGVDAALLPQVDAALLSVCGLTRPQFNVLACLIQQPATPLSEASLQLSLPTPTSRAGLRLLVEHLEDFSLVRRLFTAGNRKVRIIEITAHGREVYFEAVDAYARVIQGCEP
ncbi:hypothetical protein GCM10022251_74960 [Phytohabitans flavus]|uniref:HTH marR-type domain-containing protein n=1 Tax=Phytohabitans flavus TaxID=1076124 RepID=A0A6F8XLF8_9ACTN|nr:hypothetical protein [Phytohabitans flavus]BCB74645.1 hypothetical protein Pflav_010550 [Phytohabitans flavus]